MTLNAELQSLKLWKAEAELERAATEAAAASPDKGEGKESAG